MSDTATTAGGLQEERDELLAMLKLVATPKGWEHLIDAHKLILRCEGKWEELKALEAQEAGPIQLEVDGAMVEVE